jgi:hypothetical protein
VLEFLAVSALDSVFHVFSYALDQMVLVEQNTRHEISTITQDHIAFLLGASYSRHLLVSDTNISVGFAKHRVRRSNTRLELYCLHEVRAAGSFLFKSGYRVDADCLSVYFVCFVLVHCD